MLLDLLSHQKIEDSKENLANWLICFLEISYYTDRSLKSRLALRILFVACILYVQLPVGIAVMQLYTMEPFFQWKLI